MPVTNKRGTIFGIKQVDIAAVPTAPATPPVWKMVPSVESAVFKLSNTAVEQWGNEQLQDVHRHSQKGVLTIKFNQLDLSVQEMFSGNAIYTEDVLADTTAIDFGTDAELSPPKFMVRLSVPFKNKLTNQRSMAYQYLYSADVQTSPWDNGIGSERAKLLEYVMTIQCYQSDQNEEGDPLTTPAFGRQVI